MKVLVKPPPTPFWNDVARFFLTNMDEARTSQFMLEAATDDGQTLISNDDHMAAIAVQQGMSLLSAVIKQHDWVPQVYLDHIRRVKELKGLPIVYNVNKLFTKAPARIVVKTEDTPENRESAAQFGYGGESFGWRWSSWDGWQ